MMKLARDEVEVKVMEDSFLQLCCYEIVKGTPWESPVLSISLLHLMYLLYVNLYKKSIG